MAQIGFNLLAALFMRIIFLVPSAPSIVCVMMSAYSYRVVNTLVIVYPGMSIAAHSPGPMEVIPIWETTSQVNTANQVRYIEPNV